VEVKGSSSCILAGLSVLVFYSGRIIFIESFRITIAEVVCSLSKCCTSLGSINEGVSVGAVLAQNRLCSQQITGGDGSFWRLGNSESRFAVFTGVCFGRAICVGGNRYFYCV